MTKEEAIEILKGDFSKVTLEENESHSDVFSRAFNMAIDALEKQIPKKPILKDGKSLIHYNKGDEPHELKLEKWQDWVCPECGWFVGQRHNASQSRHHDQRKSNFCNECGQAIDWSEEE